MEKRARFPSSIPYIIGNEAAERFSFYGMKAILTVFLVTQFYNPDNNPALSQAANAHANDKTHFFNTMVYLLPILGGLIADWYWGKYKTILYLSLVYCAGNACLAIFHTDINLFSFGLLLIAVGSGGIKPCVSANVGDQFDDSNKELMSKAFSLFYFSINFGSFFSTLLIPLVLKYYGPGWAFGIPGILMFIATIIFIAGNKKYVKVPASGFKKENFVAINFYMLKNLFNKKPGESLYQIAANKYSAASLVGIKSVWRILAVFAFVPCFWMLNDQNSSEWVLQAAQMDLHFMGVTCLASQVQAANPILVLLFIPLFNYFIYPTIEKAGINFNPYRKIGTGFILGVISFIVIWWIQTQLDAGLKPGIAWQLLAYIIITAGEVLVYQTGLEYAYTQAPASMKSTIMSFWLLTIAIGNYLVSLINTNIASGGLFAKLEGANYYLFFIILMGVVTIIYFIISTRFKENEVIIST
ncbi:MAG TPA: POT family MFS transporter [Saprospiraceae bacterium]|nr:POT family MFS transporter [Saprospiraceae bacterium]